MESKRQYLLGDCVVVVDLPITCPRWGFHDRPEMVSLTPCINHLNFFNRLGHLDLIHPNP